MPINPELLEILACPVCKAKVMLKEDGSGLKCVECKRVYPVKDDIPIMLVDQATIEP
ncbi:MAG: Trm112 family protein [Bryobacteraceae bacterium]